MVFLNQYINKIRDYIYSSIDYGQLGTGTATPDESQTALTNPDSATKLELSNITLADKSLKFDYQLPSTEGSTATYSEFELRDNTDDLSATKVIFTGIDFEPNSDKEIHITTISYLRNI